VLADMARVAVDFSRWWLKLLMLLGQAASSFLMRQMEYDADSYEIKLAGSAAFESTTRRLAVLAEVLARAHKEAQATWNLGRHLPDNFPACVLRHESRLPMAVRENILAAVSRTKAARFDTHPSDAERVRRARESNEPGIFKLELPSSALFSHFDLVARQVTYFHYSQVLGLDLDSSNLRPVEGDSCPNPQ
jgi:Zn-dependent protease with chaperone function